MKIEVKGSYENEGGAVKQFKVDSQTGMTLEIYGGDGGFCKIQLSSLPTTIATKLQVWGNIKIEVNDKQIKTNHVLIKRT